MFCWDKIPGNDNGRLREFLRQNFDIDWVKTANIEKFDDGKTIRVSIGKNSLSLRLNDEKSRVNLKIDNVRTDEFIARMKSGKLNIYGALDTKISNSDIKNLDRSRSISLNEFNKVKNILMNFADTTEQNKLILEKNLKSNLTKYFSKSSSENFTQIVAHEKLLQKNKILLTTFLRANLRGANLSNSDLRNVDLREVNLIGAKLIGANLKGANLTGAIR